MRSCPHVNDTLLLTSGFGLAVMLGQYPCVNGWLTAKLVALIVYIVLGTVALKRGKTKRAASPPSSPPCSCSPTSWPLRSRTIPFPSCTES